MCISRHMKKEKSYLLIISQACKISWWYILRFYVCITWLSTILSVVIGDENIFKIETRLPNFKSLVLGGKKKKQAKPTKKQKKGNRTNFKSSSCQYTVLQCLYYSLTLSAFLFLKWVLTYNPAPNQKISFTATKIESSDLKMHITH